jgi:predicted N-acyltransferase
LSSLELSECVTDNTGWKPNHLAYFNNNKLDGFMPIYLKNNSHGEFVFDHSWSYALNRAGRKYYPKLLSAIPFTPCESKKIIGNQANDLFFEETLEYMASKNIETWHVLFPDKELEEDLKRSSFIERNGYKFVWKNKDYSCFDDYLSIFKSRQRKNIRSERKKISELNIKIEIKDSKNLKQSDWDEFYVFYKNTYEQRLQQPYLNKEFFRMIHKQRESVKPVIFFAKIDEKNIAGSLCFNGGDTLYGRHWGSIYNIDSLHFECCYYQGIEYCINNKISSFDPGVQGEHKIRRGFEPQKTYSYHYIKEKDFKNAINDFCKKEILEIDAYFKACQRYTPFKKEYKIY